MANTLSVMANVLRNVVSKQRIRYKENGFNLDLAYICENIIAMGYPANNIESFYRNRIEDVYKFLEENHYEHYKIYNLCSERSYDINRFHGRVAVYPFEDHNPPTIELIQTFCHDVDCWLKSDPLNVAAIHCKAGKGRTGTMICCYLIYSGLQLTAEEALSCYDEKRTKNRKGVTIPSQRRYVQYFAKLIQSGLQYERKTLQFCEIRFSNGNNYHSHGLVTCTIAVLQDTSTRLQTLQTFMIDFRKNLVVELSNPLSVSGDIRVELTQKTSRKRIFHFWFNTYFVRDAGHIEEDGDIEKLVYTFYKSEIDDVHKDKDHKFFSEDFKVQVVFKASNSMELRNTDIVSVQSEEENIYNFEFEDSKSSTLNSILPQSQSKSNSNIKNTNDFKNRTGTLLTRNQVFITIGYIYLVGNSISTLGHFYSSMNINNLNKSQAKKSLNDICCLIYNTIDMLLPTSLLPFITIQHNKINSCELYVAFINCKSYFIYTKNMWTSRIWNIKTKNRCINSNNTILVTANDANNDWVCSETFQKSHQHIEICLSIVFNMNKVFKLQLCNTDVISRNKKDHNVLNLESIININANKMLCEQMRVISVCKVPSDPNLTSKHLENIFGKQHCNIPVANIKRNVKVCKEKCTSSITSNCKVEIILLNMTSKVKYTRRNKNTTEDLSSSRCFLNYNLIDSCVNFVHKIVLKPNVYRIVYEKKKLLIQTALLISYFFELSSSFHLLVAQKYHLYRMACLHLTITGRGIDFNQSDLSLHVSIFKDLNVNNFKFRSIKCDKKYIYKYSKCRNQHLQFGNPEAILKFQNFIIDEFMEKNLINCLDTIVINANAEFYLEAFEEMRKQNLLGKGYWFPEKFSVVIVLFYRKQQFCLNTVSEAAIKRKIHFILSASSNLKSIINCNH